jgi:tRNA pseudouridine55 synthase
MSEFNGLINLNKPAGPSSAAVVNRIKRLLPRKTKIGHAGTLDPFADGVLVLLVGKATRLCERLMDQPKEYVTTVKLGATTATDDPESDEVPTPGAQPPPREAVEAALPRFHGTIEQVPPQFSAMKLAGRRAYDLARRGEPVVLQPRPVQVYEIELLDYTWPLLRLRIACGRGTYIRAIARDIGQALHVGGYLTSLTRTAVGRFTIAQAETPEKLEADGVAAHLLALPEWL